MAETFHDDQVGTSPVVAEKDKLVITPIASIPKGMEASGGWTPFSVFNGRIYWRRPIQKKK